MSKTKQGRIFLGKKDFFPQPIDLIASQREAWDNFTSCKVKEIFKKISPINDYTGRNWSLSFEDVFFQEPKITPEVAKEKGLTYSSALKAKLKLTNKRSGKEVVEDVFLVNFPKMTPVGTFVISGIERGINNQLIRSPGVYFVSETDTASRKQLFRAELRPIHGSWLEFLVGTRGTVYARIDRKKKFPATIILKAAGFSGGKEMVKRLSPQIKATLDLDPTKTETEALIEFYRRMKPGEPLILDNAQKLLHSLFFDSRTYDMGVVGRHKINKRLGLNVDENSPSSWVLSKNDMVETVAYLLRLYNNDEKARLDDIDHLANRRLRRVDEILAQSVLYRALARLERTVKERMSMVSYKDKVRPSQMISAQPIVNATNSFFKTNQLSSILDQTNPLSELDLLRKITVTGPDGIARERATFSIRDIHSSQYGRICPIRSPEGMNIGLVTYLSLFSRVNKYGFLETPYRKVIQAKKNGRLYPKITNEIVYLPADDEANYYITSAGVETDGKGFITQKILPVRFGGEFLEAPAKNVQLIDYSSQQILGVSASLIPFVAHDEVNRVLMGSNMQCQAVPLIKPEESVVGTGMERAVVRAMKRIVESRASGKVVFVDAEKIVVKPDKKEDLPADGQFEIKDGLHIYKLFKFQRTSPNGTCYNQRPSVYVGQKVAKNQLLADGPATNNGELALGKNLVIAYACIEGLGYEDAIVVSDRLVKEDVLTSIKIHEYEAQVVDTKLGPEELTKDIPGVSEADLSRLTADGTIMIGSRVSQNDVLVGKVEPKGQKELTAEERLLRAIFGEKAKEVKDTSLRVPHGESGVVIGIRELSRKKGDELPSGVNLIVKVTVAQIRKLLEGDKVAGRHGNKGVVAKVMPDRDMPYLADGRPVDIIISPLSVIARMNLGQTLESHLGLAGVKLGEKYAVSAFSQLKEETIERLLKKAGLPVSGKATLYSGYSGLPFDKKVAVGVSYISKLHHMVEDKIHARSTGPYSLVTQQPLGGKARMGGQRFGEMEVWALEAHRAAYALQEMLTIKSDDVSGRTTAFQAIIKGQKIPHSTLPESFRVLIKELAGLSLSVFPSLAEKKKTVKAKTVAGKKVGKKAAKKAVKVTAKKTAKKPNKKKAVKKKGNKK